MRLLLAWFNNNKESINLCFFFPLSLNFSLFDSSFLFPCINLPLHFLNSGRKSILKKVNIYGKLILKFGWGLHMENGFGDSYRKMEMKRTHFEIFKNYGGKPRRGREGRFLECQGQGQDQGQGQVCEHFYIYENDGIRGTKRPLKWMCSSNFVTKQWLMLT